MDAANAPEATIDPAQSATRQRDALVALLEGLDAVQALKLHSALKRLPFDAVAPSWLDWRNHIVPANPGWAYKGAPPPAVVSASGGSLTLAAITPQGVARILWSGTNNWEGIRATYPWLTFNDVAATTVWAKEVGLWPDAL